VATAPTSAPAATPPPPIPDLQFPNEPFRAAPPAAGEMRPLKTPALERFSLPGGITVFLVERHTLPLVSMSLIFEGGSAIDPKGKEGLAAVCAGLLSDGTEKLDKIAFEEAQADIASSIASGAATDQHWVSVDTLKKNLGVSLELWTDTLLRPGMRQDELDRNLKRSIAGLQQMKGNPGAVAGRLSGSVVYGAHHLYGRFATEASYGAISLPDCKEFVADYVKPQGSRLYVVGDVSKAELTQELTARLKGWSGRPKASPPVGTPRPRAGKIFFVDMPNAPQSVVQLMHLGPPRKAPDYHPTSIMSGILGGGFASRINMNIREKHGYAYGARGAFDYARQGSIFRASASVRTDVTKESIEEILNEIRGLKAAPPSDEELVREKDGKVLALPAQFATGGQVLSAFRDLIYFGLPMNYFDNYIPNVRAVDKAAVKKAAAKYLKPESIQLLVVGDGKIVLPKLQELVSSKELKELHGKIVELDTDGNPVTGS
jgi:zinc protease